tara:strand:- start:586 stop:1548 length:963 start_codon:yes stop_codon:yes gene_type:complete
MQEEDLEARYSIGDACTFDEMVARRDTEKEASIHNPFKNMACDQNPYVFEDKPVGMRRFVVVNIVGDKFRQKHETNSCMLKVKASTASIEQAKKMCTSLEEKDSKYALYILEMFKFVCLPPPEYECDVDSEMNTAIEMEYERMQESHEEFKKRKKVMMDEIERHNKIAQKIADGELDQSKAESDPILPENMQEREEESTAFPESMEPDSPLCNDKFVVVATLKIEKYEKMENSIIIKICGTFSTESDAESHMKSLKKDTKYKLFDISVCDMYAWLEMPPPYERIDHVLFDSNKLTESLGERKQSINIDSTDLQCPRDLDT